MCEKKRRFQARGDKGVVIGLQTYIYFYQYTQHNSKSRTLDDFENSPYYIAFVKFGNYCLNVNAVRMSYFIKYVVQKSIPLDKWATDKVYTEYLHYITATEDVGDALVRTVKYSEDWGKQKDMRSQDLLRYGSRNRICHAINTGHISPWAIYNSASGMAFLDNLTEEQIQVVYEMIDPDHWTDKFNNAADDVKFAKEVLGVAGW